MNRILLITIALIALSTALFAHDWTMTVSVSEPIRCHGLKGKVTVSWTNLTAPIVISMNGEEVGRDEQNGSGSFVISGVTAGRHSFTVEEDPIVPIEVHSKTMYDTITEPDTFRIASKTIVSPSLGQSNGSIYLEVAGGTKPYDMEWSTDPIQYGPMVKNIPADYYIMSLTDAKGCDWAYLEDLYESTPSSVTTQNLAAKAIYPNPCNTGKLQIPSGTNTARLYSITGQLLESRHVSGMTEWNLEQYPEGCYLVELLGLENDRLRSTLIIE